MDYKERLEMLIDSVGGAKLNDKEFSAIYNILGLSKRRIDNNREYNNGINKAIEDLRIS